MSEDPNSLTNVRGKTLRLPDDVWRRLEAESKRTGLSVTEIIRQAINAQLLWLERLERDDEP